jgi:hypothetical protein
MIVIRLNRVLDHTHDDDRLAEVFIDHIITALWNFLETTSHLPDMEPMPLALQLIKSWIIVATCRDLVGFFHCMRKARAGIVTCTLGYGRHFTAPAKVDIYSLFNE